MTSHELVSMTLKLPVVFRLATKEDISRLEWFGQYKHYRRIFRRTYRDQQIGRRLMILADVNGFPIGQIFVQLRSARGILADGDSRAYLYALRVMEMFQGNKIGTNLINEAERMLIEREYSWATIAVAKDNHGAQRLYQRLDYVTFAEDDGSWQYVDHEGNVRTVNEPCWLMEKRLQK